MEEVPMPCREPVAAGRRRGQGRLQSACSHISRTAAIGLLLPAVLLPVRGAAAAPEWLAPVSLEAGGLTISVDPRLEVLSIVQYLGGVEPITKLESRYRGAVDSAFGAFRGHRAVALVRAMADTGFSFDAPPNATLHRGLELGPSRAFSPYVVRRGGSERKLENYFGTLAAFAEESGFAAFFNAHREFYRSMVAAAASQIGELQQPSLLEAYYGEQMGSYNIVLVPLYMPGGFGVEVDADGVREIYSVQGPLAVEEGLPSFGTEQSFTYLVWHEFSHSFVNPLTRTSIEAANRYAPLYEPLADAMRRQAYGNWESTLNEHIVRAVTTRLAYLNYGAAEGDRARSHESGRGFVYLDALVEALERYESQRDRYPALRDFYPELLAALDRYLR
jgi:hypothetical protein